ncbi:flagellar hook-associated family protein [Mesorhizobium sp. KR1-2]|uniref:flagellar hook-associated family protein n=1 Tax=Mesorhizobium sp. KR1-2 TaxID=3156609 RepID=UPI0032B41779
MKASFVSSSAISEAMRYSLMKTQVALAKAQKEQSTGFYADKGLALGARSSQSVSFNRELERIKGIVDSNAIAAMRLSATQLTLGNISDAAQSFLSVLTTGLSGNVQSSVITDSAKDMLSTLLSLNTSVAGEYLFAGINTDVRPINDFQDPASDNRAAFDAAYQQYLTEPGVDPANPFPTVSDMDKFISQYVEPQFTAAEVGGSWQNWSKASDQLIVSRIALNETVETSVSANNEGMRKLAMAAVVIGEFLSMDLNRDVRQSLVDRAISLVGQAIGDVDKLRSQTGIAEKRVSDASERLSLQSTLLEKNILATEGVEPYEAAARVSDYLSHIETSYAITARIQQLSLLKFLS